VEEKKTDERSQELRDYMRIFAAAGGRARAAKLTPEKRTRIARKGGKAAARARVTQRKELPICGGVKP